MRIRFIQYLIISTFFSNISFASLSELIINENIDSGYEADSDNEDYDDNNLESVTTKAKELSYQIERNQILGNKLEVNVLKYILENILNHTDTNSRFDELLIQHSQLNCNQALSKENDSYDDDSSLMSESDSSEEVISSGLFLASSENRAVNSKVPNSAFDLDTIEMKSPGISEAYAKENPSNCDFFIISRSDINVKTGEYKTRILAPKLELSEEELKALLNEAPNSYLELNVSKFKMDNIGQYIMPILVQIENSYGYSKLAGLPVFGNLGNGLIVEQSTSGQFYAVLERSPESYIDQWLRVPLIPFSEYIFPSFKMRNKLEEYKSNLRESTKVMKGSTASDYPDLLLNLGERIDEKVSQLVASDKEKGLFWEGATDFEYFAEMAGVYDWKIELEGIGSLERSISRNVMIAKAIEKILSTKYSYAKNSSRFCGKSLTPLQLLEAGEFQCDTAAVLMSAILTDVYGIPSQIVETFNGVLIKKEFIADRYDGKTLGYFAADTTGPSHARVLVPNEYSSDFSSYIYDPTPIN